MARSVSRSTEQNHRSPQSPGDDVTPQGRSASIESLQQVAEQIICDAHRFPREYLRRVDTQQQGE